jgi:hypothetical protein
MATFVPNLTMDNKHKIFAIVKNNVISQNGEFSPHEKTLHGPCVFYTFMNGSSSTNTIYTWDGC